MERLCELHTAGVSIWLDTLSRHLVASGEFGSLIDDACVTGATSNPTIFAAAIRGADGYEQQLQALLGSGARNAQAIFFDLALDDVRHAPSRPQRSTDRIRTRPPARTRRATTRNLGRRFPPRRPSRRPWSIGTRLGLARLEVKGPWILKLLFARRRSSRILIPWDRVRDIGDERITADCVVDECQGALKRP
jgi:Transaldolase/Fructose-6-phosphate aldolase